MLLRGAHRGAVAHRLTTAMKADRIVVVDDGRIAEVGSHEQLLARGGLYAQMYATWISHTRSSGGVRRSDLPHGTDPGADQRYCCERATKTRTKRSPGRKRGGGGTPVPREAWMRLLACTGRRGAAADRRNADHGRAAVGRARPERLQRLDRDRAERLLRPLRARAAPGGRLVDRLEARRSRWSVSACSRSARPLGALVVEHGRARRQPGRPGGRRRPRQPRGARRRGQRLPARAPRLARSGSGARAPGSRTSSGRCSAACSPSRLGWRANWWALVPLALLVARSGSSAFLPASRTRAGRTRSAACSTRSCSRRR